MTTILLVTTGTLAIPPWLATTKIAFFDLILNFNSFRLRAVVAGPEKLSKKGEFIMIGTASGSDGAARGPEYGLLWAGAMPDICAHM